MPTYLGRNLPLNDWEGDDFTPGAGGDWVTCMDTSAGRMVAWATNGRITKDGKQYRAAVNPPDPNGIHFSQAAQAVKSLTGLTLIYHNGWTQAGTLSWLKHGNGLIVTGLYSKIPRNFRWQASADFNHAMFIAYATPQSFRVWDPLNPQTHEYGASVPQSALWSFIGSLGWSAGYVPLQHL